MKLQAHFKKAAAFHEALKNHHTAMAKLHRGLAKAASARAERDTAQLHEDAAELEAQAARAHGDHVVHLAGMAAASVGGGEISDQGGPGKFAKGSQDAVAGFFDALYSGKLEKSTPQRADGGLFGD
jgi:hypothetical protein